eukprot:557887-Prymnesium_polylepis.1
MRHTRARVRRRASARTSPITKPARFASKGRLAVSGESLAVVHMARMLVKPAKPSAVTAASVPPASMTSASPYWMYLNASPIACVPVAHAETTPKLGPCARNGVGAVVLRGLFAGASGGRREEGRPR